MNEFYKKEFYSNEDKYTFFQFGEKNGCKFYYMQPKSSHSAVLPAILKINVYGIIENMVIAPAKLHTRISA